VLVVVVLAVVVVEAVAVLMKTDDMPEHGT